MVSAGKDWSTDEMRAAADNWTLANDVSLREHLVSFGQRLEENYRQVQESLGQLDQKIESSSIHLGNVANRLSLLSNTQFVESRVSDDDETVSTETKLEKVDKTNPEESFCQKVGEALTAGAAFVEGAFETIDFENSDSEDDEDVLKDLEPIYESRNVYHLRRLPHVVGTQKFLIEENIGLEPSGDEKEDTSGLSESEESDVEDEIESSGIAPNAQDQVSDYSLSDQDTEEENRFRAKIEAKKRDQMSSPATKPKKIRKEEKGIFSSTSDDDDLFDGANTKSQMTNLTAVDKSDLTKTLTSFVGELSSKIGSNKEKAFRSSSEGDDNDDRTSQTSSQKSLSSQNQPNVIESENTLMMPSPLVGELSTRVGAKKLPLPKSSQNGGPSLSEEDTRPNKVADSVQAVPVPSKPVKTSVKKEKSIFDSGSSSEDEMFIKAAQLPVKTEHASIPERQVQQVNQSTEEVFQAKISLTSGDPKEQLTTSKPVKGSSTLFDSDSDSDDLFSSAKPVKPTQSNKSAQQPPPTVKSKEKLTRLFSSEDEEVGPKTVFTSPATTPATAITTEKIVSNATKSVTKEINTQPKPAPIKEIKKTSLFDDSSSSDDDMDVLFKKASSGNPSSSAKTHSPAPVLPEKNIKSKSLFSESSEEDPIFEAPSRVQKEEKDIKSTFSDHKEGVEVGKNETVVVIKSEDIVTENLEKEKAQIVEDKKKEFLTKTSIIQNVPLTPDSSKTDKNTNITTASSVSAVPVEPSSDLSNAVVDDKEESQSFGDDVADGNAMSFKKDVKFKDILTAKLAKGPRTVGKRKTSSSAVDPAVSHSDLLGRSEKAEDNVKATSTISSKSVDNNELSKRIEKETKPIPNVEKAPEKIEAEKNKPEPQNPIDGEVSSPVLESLTKSRAKLPTNRRPPTKKALKAMGESGTDQTDFGLPDQQKEPFPVTDNNIKIGSEVKSEKTKVIISEPITTSSPEKKTEEIKSLKPEEGEGPLLSTVVQFVETVSSSNIEKSTLFVAQDSNEVKVVAKSEPIVATSSVILKPEDSPESPKANSDPVHNADDSGDDDLFGPPPMPDVIKANHDPLFGSPSSDEDDLFAAEKKTKLRSATATAASLFDDDDSDDDLFASH